MLMKGVGAFLFIVTESSSTPQFHSTLTSSSHFHDLEYKHRIFWFKTKLIFSQSRVCTVSDPAFLKISGLISMFTTQNSAFLCSQDQEGSRQLSVVQVHLNNILHVFCFLHQLECSWVHDRGKDPQSTGLIKAQSGFKLNVLNFILQFLMV